MRDQIIAIYIIPFIAQIVVPLALLAWQVFGNERTSAGWLIKSSAVIAYLAVIAVAGLWLDVGRYQSGERAAPHHYFEQRVFRKSDRRRR